MEFAAFVGNPPYNDSEAVAYNNKLWVSITNNILDYMSLNSYIGLVTPSSALRDIGAPGKIHKRISSGEEFHLLCSEVHPKGKYFNVAVETCHWVAKKEPKHVVNTEQNSISNEICDIVVNSTYPRLKLIMQNGHVSRNKNGDVSESYSDDYCNKIQFSGSNIVYTKRAVEGYGMLKLVFPFSTSYNHQFVTKLPLGMNNLFCEISDLKDANVKRSFSMSKLYQYVAAHYRKTAGYTPFVKNTKMPDLGGHSYWTDGEVFSAFPGLTPTHIAEVIKWFDKRAKSSTKYPVVFSEIV